MNSGHDQMHRWRLLSRPGCGLCAELAEALEEAFGIDGYTLEWINVDTRDDWRRDWGLLIPVLLDEAGRAISVTRLDVVAVAEALGRAPRQRRRRL